jgi:hypothetical protein
MVRTFRAAAREPKETAAWYANSAPRTRLDRRGRRRQRLAQRRLGEPARRGAIAIDDGFNSLRIAHPEPLGVVYWEIGSEVFGNGYYEGRD